MSVSTCVTSMLSRRPSLQVVHALPQREAQPSVCTTRDTQTPVPCGLERIRLRHGSNEQNTTSQIEGDTPWGRRRRVLMQREGIQHSRAHPEQRATADDGGEMQQALRRGIPRAVTMGLGLVMGRVMVMRGLTILVMVMGQRVVVILMERGRARMGE